ncbi:hypothetical protein [Winogradskyella sp.]|uniref:hypothetical protein n=1 Tax=Winogradskyella sp. TaxID=1883156 RepID=UPI003BA8DCA2
MKEEQLKKIIQKSTVETSDQFINNLMSSIDHNQERKKTLKSLFKRALIAISIVSIAMSYVLYQYLDSENSLGILPNIPKTPLFVIFMVVILFYINTFIRTNEQNRI